MTIFYGFEEDAFAFLNDVRQYNSKDWFDGPRHVYESRLLMPFRALVETLGISMQQIDNVIEIRPAVGKTISQLRRDTRFSNDKSLYRDNMWLTFKRPKKNWTDAPTYFFEFGPDWWRYGLGYYSASPATMSLFRDRLLEFPREFQQAIKSIPKEFAIHAESYKRQIPPDSLPPELVPWYKKKSFYIANRGTDMAPLLSRKLPNMLLKGFEQLSGMYRFLVSVELMKQEKSQLQTYQNLNTRLSEGEGK